MAVIAHEMDLTMGLFEIGKLRDFRSLPDTCWLECVQPKSMMGCDLRCSPLFGKISGAIYNHLQ